MGIHYDYKSTREDKNLRKKQKRDARRHSKKPKTKTTNNTFRWDRQITLDDLTRPNKDND